MDSEIIEDLIYIEFEAYRKYANCNESYEGSTKWDEQAGISYIQDVNYKKLGYMTFKIIDKSKFFLAKIKHGL